MAEDDLWSGEEWWAKEIQVGLPENWIEVQIDEGHVARRVAKEIQPTANAQALKLLVTHLNPLELECFTKFRAVPVVDVDGHYWLLFYNAAPSGSAHAVGIGVLCWYPGYDAEGNRLPKGDIVLGQKFALETGAFKEWVQRRIVWPVNPQAKLALDAPEFVPYFPQ